MALDWWCKKPACIDYKYYGTTGEIGRNGVKTIRCSCCQDVLEVLPPDELHGILMERLKKFDLLLCIAYEQAALEYAKAFANRELTHIEEEAVRSLGFEHYLEVAKENI